MRVGESFVCPRCGERSIVKSKNKMEGFTLIGKVLVCALCGAELGNPADGSAEKTPSNSGRLAALLGESAPPGAKADLTPDEGYGRFCRNCVHFIEHPFKTLCGIDGHAADPMGECPRFKKKE